MVFLLRVSLPTEPVVTHVGRTCASFREAKLLAEWIVTEHVTHSELNLSTLDRFKRFLQAALRNTR